MTNELNTNKKYKPIQKEMQEDWSSKYKKSIDCNNPKGFSQRAHCQGKKKMREDAPTNIVSGGQIAGVGVGPQGEPGIKKKKDKLLSFTSFIKRKSNVAS